MDSIKNIRIRASLDAAQAAERAARIIRNAVIAKRRIDPDKARTASQAVVAAKTLVDAAFGPEACPYCHEVLSPDCCAFGEAEI